MSDRSRNLPARRRSGGAMEVRAVFWGPRDDDLVLSGISAGTQRDSGSSRTPGSWSHGMRTPRGTVPFDENLLQRTLAFADSYVSDDGQVTVRRAAVSAEYSGARFAGHCAPCSRAGLLPEAGEALLDVRAAVQFISAHSHGDRD